MDYIVTKFGGSSLANAGQMGKVEQILASDPKRKYVVVSAPGKDPLDKQKMTDHLFNIAEGGKHFSGQNISAKDSYDAVVGKFERIASDLGVDASAIISKLREDLSRDLPSDRKIDFYASRGEYVQSQIFAEYLSKKGLNAKAMLPEDIGFFVSADWLNAKVLRETYHNLAKMDHDGLMVLPGYCGVTKEGDFAVFSRGGSDLTGGILAAAVKARMYENWTDTDGVFQVDPRLIKEARPISELTYKEIRILATKGFNVLHYAAMLPCKKEGVPINIKNTNNPSAPGTMIVGERVPMETVVGIARLDDIAYIYVEKEMMDEDVGFTGNLLQIFKDSGISTHHYPTDKDDISVLVQQSSLVGKVDNLMSDIKKKLSPDRVEANYGLSILVPVGLGMRDTPGILSKAATALFDQGINIEVVDQGPAQISFLLGVKTSHADKALQALYKTFFK